MLQILFKMCCKLCSKICCKLCCKIFCMTFVVPFKNCYFFRNLNAIRSRLNGFFSHQIKDVYLAWKLSKRKHASWSFVFVKTTFHTQETMSTFMYTVQYTGCYTYTAHNNPVTTHSICICTVRKVLSDFVVRDGWCHCKALCDEEFSQIEGNSQKFSHTQHQPINFLTVY